MFRDATPISVEEMEEKDKVANDDAESYAGSVRWILETSSRKQALIEAARNIPALQDVRSTQQIFMQFESTGGTLSMMSQYLKSSSLKLLPRKPRPSAMKRPYTPSKLPSSFESLLLSRVIDQSSWKTHFHCCKIRQRCGSRIQPSSNALQKLTLPRASHPTWQWMTQCITEYNLYAVSIDRDNITNRSLIVIQLSLEVWFELNKPPYHSYVTDQTWKSEEMLAVVFLYVLHRVEAFRTCDSFARMQLENVGIAPSLQEYVNVQNRSEWDTYVIAQLRDTSRVHMQF
ncbi:hypothetical protein FRC02_007728 [Tulasnella sp. 418]|nr:hypothetical protein FRC02_007728 [Tulasnella sp. 418]